MQQAQSLGVVSQSNYASLSAGLRRQRLVGIRTAATPTLSLTPWARGSAANQAAARPIAVASPIDQHERAGDKQVRRGDGKRGLPNSRRTNAPAAPGIVVFCVRRVLCARVAGANTTHAAGLRPHHMQQLSPAHLTSPPDPTHANTPRSAPPAPATPSTTTPTPLQTAAAPPA